MGSKFCVCVSSHIVWGALFPSLTPRGCLAWLRGEGEGGFMVDGMISLHGEVALTETVSLIQSISHAASGPTTIKCEEYT